MTLLATAGRHPAIAVLRGASRDVIQTILGDFAQQKGSRREVMGALAFIWCETKCDRRGPARNS